MQQEVDKVQDDEFYREIEQVDTDEPLFEMFTGHEVENNNYDDDNNNYPETDDIDDDMPISKMPFGSAHANMVRGGSDQHISAQRSPVLRQPTSSSVEDSTKPLAPEHNRP